MATKSTPDGVDLKLSNYSTTAAMNGSIALASNATLATVAANYGLKTVVDQRSLTRWWLVRPSSGCSVVLATHTVGAVSVDLHPDPGSEPWNIVRRPGAPLRLPVSPRPLWCTCQTTGARRVPRPDPNWRGSSRSGERRCRDATLVKRRGESGASL